MIEQLMSIKAKKFGVRLTGFRQKQGVSVETLSQWTGISKGKIKSIETGKATASLPIIELIAQKLGFVAETLLSGELEIAPQPEVKNEFNGLYTALRDRIIALNLRMSRTELDKSLDSVAAKCGIKNEELEQYESGSTPIPLPVLECLCDEYHLPVSALLTKKTTIIAPADREPVPSVASNQIPYKLSEFINDPSNLPYLELAKKLSELDAAKLRNIAEGLLEITY